MRQHFSRALIALAFLGVAALHAAAQATTVILVRHAEKADAPANDPPLTDAGRARAQRLADYLSKAGVSAIYSTDVARTRETAAPLAQALGVQVALTPYAGNAVQYASDLAASIRKNHKGATVLVVGHSNTTPEVVKALAGSGVPAIPDPEYDNLYIVLLSEGGRASLIRARY